MSVKTYDKLEDWDGCGFDKGSQATIKIGFGPTDKRLDVSLEITANVGGNYATILEKTTLEVEGEFGTVANTKENQSILYDLARTAARGAVYKPRKGNLKHLGKEVALTMHYLSQFLEDETGIALTSYS